MSTIWSQYFTEMAWDGGQWGMGNFIDNDSSPEEIILHLAWWELAQDPLLQQIFKNGQSIEAMEVRNPTEFRDLPRLQVYLATLDEEQVPTRIDINQIGVYVGIRYDAHLGMNKLIPGEATAASVLRKVKTVLKGNKQLVTMVNGIQTPLAKGSSRQEGGISFQVDFDESGGRSTFTQEMQWLYDVEINHDQGRIQNIINAGG